MNDKQKPDPALKKKGAKVESRKQGSTSEHKPETVAETVSKPKPADKKPSQSNPPQKRKSEEGSLLSMVSSCAVDPTVAASEKVHVYTIFIYYLHFCHDAKTITLTVTLHPSSMYNVFRSKAQLTSSISCVSALLISTEFR